MIPRARSSRAALALGVLAPLWTVAGCGRGPAGERSVPADSPPAPAPAASAPAAAPAQTGPAPTWSADVAPIVYAKCATCHRPTGGAPFPLLTYEQARRRARQIGIVTASRFMPPWLPAPGDYAFLGERRLDDEELATLQRWAAAGAPEGDPAAAPPAPQFPEGWQLGEPDLVVEMPQAYTVPAQGNDVFRNFVLPVPVNRPRWVRAAEILPDNRTVVHHATMAVDRLGSARLRDAADPDVGYEAMDPLVETDAPNGFFLNWKPGTVPNPGSDDMSFRVDPQTDLVLNMHMQPTGKPEKLRVKVGLFFADAPPTRYPLILNLDADEDLDIPPGATDYTVTDDFVLPLDVQVLGAYPHMHYLGKSVTGIATLPDGTQKTLIDIPHWDFNWQAVYTYRDPVPLPAGTRIEMRCVFDNSTDNPLNPNDPPKRVRTGYRSEDEMAHLALQVLPAEEKGVYVLQEALMRSRIAQHEDNANAHARLGDALRSLDRNEEALAEYRRAVELRPGDSTARNNLAGLLLAQGDRAGAERELRATIAADPSYVNGHDNLAILLLARGAVDEAQTELERVLALDPKRGSAHDRLGRILTRKGKAEEARQHFEAALAIDASDVEAHFGLGALLASLGRRDEAIAELERVLALQPGHAGALQGLASLKGGSD